jgi:hypothetical protein
MDDKPEVVWINTEAVTESDMSVEEWGEMLQRAMHGRMLPGDEKFMRYTKPEEVN